MLQSSHEVVAQRGSLIEEMAGGELGDQRLNERRDRLVAVLEQHPDAGFPDACASDAEVEALYRFLRNRRLSLAAIMEPHLVATRTRCAAVGEVLVIHDTTEMVFAGDTPRRGLARLGPGRHGFWVHAALAVSADGCRAPLGVVALRSFIRKTRPPGTPRRWRERFADPDKESRCWAHGVATARTRFAGAVEAIHVMDRAGDSYELFAEWLAHGDRFVVRLNHDRRVVTDEGGGTLTDVAPATPMCTRVVRVGRRGDGNRPQRSVQQHPPRAERVATVHMGVRRVALQRPHGVSPTLPETLAVTVVYVHEVAPPAGEDAVVWRLVTSEPVETVEDLLRVVDWYRTRWLIEEFFKALKTGCAYEKRQLESLATLLIALALLAPVAWQLLLLRHLAHAVPDGTATMVLSHQQLQVLRAAPAGARLGPQPTIGDALLAIARLGGHLRQNGPPGWLVLGRGMQKLLWMESGWTAAHHSLRCDQS
jgi:hypothetical protein